MISARGGEDFSGAAHSIISVRRSSRREGCFFVYEIVKCNPDSPEMKRLEKINAAAVDLSF